MIPCLDIGRFRERIPLQLRPHPAANVGLTSFDALRAATAGPAEFLGQSHILGTVVAKKRAELVLLDADPLADIRNTRKIHAVVTAARLYDRAALDKMSGPVARLDNTYDHPLASWNPPQPFSPSASEDSHL